MALVHEMHGEKEPKDRHCDNSHIGYLCQQDLISETHRKKIKRVGHQPDSGRSQHGSESPGPFTSVLLHPCEGSQEYHHKPYQDRGGGEDCIGAHDLLPGHMPLNLLYFNLDNSKSIVLIKLIVRDLFTRIPRHPALSRVGNQSQRWRS